MSLRRLLLALFVLALGATALASSPACVPPSAPSCDPGSAGLGGAPAASFRRLPGPQIVGCAPTVRLARSASELQGILDQLDDSDGGTQAPSVDFAHEVAVVVLAQSGEGVQWAVSQGTHMTVGLQGCGQIPQASCVLTILAVTGAVETVDTHECDAVACGL